MFIIMTQYSDDGYAYESFPNICTGFLDPVGLNVNKKHCLTKINLTT